MGKVKGAGRQSVSQDRGGLRGGSIMRAISRTMLAGCFLISALGLGRWSLSFAGVPLNGYEPPERLFEETVIGDKLVYFHQRMIGQAVVEKDYIVYQFKRSTGELLARKSHWRDDLPESLPDELIPQSQAESLVDGEVLFSKPYYISPESDVFPLSPTPKNPCWVVRSKIGESQIVTIIDAVEGKVLGNGVPPPYTAFSFSGPVECPASGAWTSWYLNAAQWFDLMGYDTESVQWPSKAKIRSHVKSDSTTLFYEICHGGSDSFIYACEEGWMLSIVSWQIEVWISNFAKMPFTFLASCEGMCDTTDGSFSYEFRKGSAESTATVGYCHMDQDYCSDCWTYSLDWQDALFRYIDQGWTVREAFDQANADYPACGIENCMRFAGDPTFALVPSVRRDPWAPLVTVIAPNGGETLEAGEIYEIRWTAKDNAHIAGVTILLSSDGGMTFPDTIAADEPNDSSFVWLVPDIHTRTARIMIVAVDGALNEGFDTSDADFTILGSLAGMERLAAFDVPVSVVLETDGVSAGVLNIWLGLPVATDVALDLYEVTGKRVTSVFTGNLAAGYHQIHWTVRGEAGSVLSPGIYFLRVQSDCGTCSAKVVLAK